MLRSEKQLKSAAEARQEYLDLLQGKSTYLIPIRIGLRTFATPASTQAVMAPPFFWLQGGVEAALTQARAWTGNLMLGVTWLPDLHVGVIAQARLARLISGNTTSLTHPDVYAFVGGAVIYVNGRTAAMFQNQVPDLDALIDLTNMKANEAFLGTFHLGFELRVKNRIGVAVFMEALPGLTDSSSVGTYWDLGIRFSSLGVEVSFCF
jgi:hypothetical protein